jgi:hypothetical protein
MVLQGRQMPEVLMMSDDVRWVRCAKDIPDGDLKNYSINELLDRYTKIRKGEIILERSRRFPKRYPLPKEYALRQARYAKSLTVTGVKDLRDIAFSELDDEGIRIMYPRLGLDDIVCERHVRRARAILEKSGRMLLGDRANAVVVLEGLIEDLESVRWPNMELEGLLDHIRGMRSNILE